MPSILENLTSKAKTIDRAKNLIMNRIKEIVPEALITYEGESCCFEPTSDDGFPVELYEGEYDTTVIAGLWHKHFDSVEDAEDLFLMLLSHNCRMRYDYCGNALYKNVIEKEKGSLWKEIASGMILFHPFWLQKQSIYKQNDILTDDFLPAPTTLTQRSFGKTILLGTLGTYTLSEQALHLNLP